MTIASNEAVEVGRCEAFPVSIYIAGPASEIERACASYAAEQGLCVTVTPLRFIFTGGREDGVRVGLINYARFPSNYLKLTVTAVQLAKKLIVEVSQGSATVETPTDSIFISRREQDKA